jgi:glutathione S-transferase
MKLFWTPASPFVRKVVITAIELDLVARIQLVPTFWPHAWGTRTIEFEEAFITANPVGRIPTLITEDGIALPESNLICQYLDSLNGQPRLLPTTGKARWECMRALAVSDGALEAMIARRAESLRTPAERSSDFLAKQRDRVARCFDCLDKEAGWMEGERTAAQISAGAACGYMDFRYPQDQWQAGRPRLQDWYDSFSRRRSMRETVPSETPERRTL